MQTISRFFRQNPFNFLRPLLVSFVVFVVFLSAIFTVSTKIQQSDARDVFYSELGAKLSFISSELEHDILLHSIPDANNGIPLGIDDTLRGALKFAEIKCLKLQTLEKEYFAPPEAFCKKLDKYQEIEIPLPSISSVLFVLIDEHPLNVVLSENLLANLITGASLVLVMSIIIGTLVGRLNSKQLQESIKEIEAKIYSNPLPILRVDSDGLIIEGNVSWRELTDNVDLQSLNLRDILPNEHVKDLRKVFEVNEKHDLSAAFEFKQVKLLLPGFRQRFFNVSAKAAKIRNRSIFLLTFAEITSLIVEREIIKRMLRTDELTGALTRRAMYEDYDHDQRTTDYSFILFDIDFFKSVNDFYGHAVGDRYLQSLVHEISENIGQDAELIRLGGEEFVVIQPCSSAAELSEKSELIQRFGNALKIDVDEAQVSRTISVGAILLKPNMKISKALSYADEALGKAKEAGRNRVFINAYPEEEATTKIPRRAQLDQVRQALELGDFKIHLQKICNYGNQRPVGYETLMRWNVDGKNIPPYLFIDEYYKVLNTLSLNRPRYQVFTRALDELINPERAWISINIRVDDLLDGRVDALLNEFKPYQKTNTLVLEISEELISDRINADEIQNHINTLKNAGFVIALDDFGKEGSNLQRLSSFPIDIVKLDKFFTSDIEFNSKNQKLVKSLVTLGEGLGFELIVEGIETEAQARIFADLGILAHQGFYYSKPMPISDVNLVNIETKN